MTTSINGTPADWPPEVWTKWHTAADCADPKFYVGEVTTANYFTPRPYVDQYNRGDRKEGFTYTIRRPNGYDQEVVAVCINGYPAGLVQPQGAPQA